MISINTLIGALLIGDVPHGDYRIMTDAVSDGYQLLATCDGSLITTPSGDSLHPVISPMAATAVWRVKDHSNHSTPQQVTPLGVVSLLRLFRLLPRQSITPPGI